MARDARNRWAGILHHADLDRINVENVMDSRKPEVDHAVA